MPAASAQRQVDGRVVPEDAAWATLDRLRSRGLLASADEACGAGGPDGGGEDPELAPIYSDLPPTDLEATHRTLAEVTRRANARLAAG